MGLAKNKTAAATSEGSAKRAMAKVRERFTECVLLLYVDMPIIIGLSLVLVYFSLVILSIHIMNR